MDVYPWRSKYGTSTTIDMNSATNPVIHMLRNSWWHLNSKYAIMVTDPHICTAIDPTSIIRKILNMVTL